MIGRRRTAATAAVFFAGALSVWAQPGTEGHVNYLQFAESWFDQYTLSPDATLQSWFQTHFQQMVVWSPYFDTRTSWFPNSIPYINLFGVLQGSWVQYAHPEWILKDQYGNWLYIPFQCSNGSCPMYAGDLANPAFRAWWISQAQSTISAGNYPGLYIDDVDMLFRVSDGYYNQTAPVDTNTGQLMSFSAWKSYVAQFTTQIRAAFPSANIMHNVIWFAGDASDPSIQQEFLAATKLNLERGIASDPGLTGGTGYWSIYNFFSYIDRVHALGKGINFMEYNLTSAGQEYGLASYFLISNGKDSVGDSSTTPTNWFSGYSVDLGPALGMRTYNNGVFERTFTRGMVVLGEPGLTTQTVTLPTSMQRLDGSWVTSVTIAGSQGIILQGNPQTSSTPSTQWSSLGGSFQGRASIAANQDGRLEAFARGTDNQLWHNWQTSAGGPWSGWSPLGGVLGGNPAAVTNQDGRLEVFALGSDSSLWHIWQITAGGSWSAWSAAGPRLQSDPAVAVNNDGRLELFAQGPDGSVWHAWQTTAGGGWSAWAGLGGAIYGRPAVGKNADGRLEVFVQGRDNALWHSWQLYVGGNWSNWSSLGSSMQGNPMVSTNADGRLEAFVLGTDSALWHAYQTSANGSWSSFSSLGGRLTTDPTATINTDGRLEVFARGTDDALWHIWQNSAGASWSNWASLGGVISDQASVGRNSDGRLEIVDREGDNALWHIAQSAAGSWN